MKKILFSLVLLFGLTSTVNAWSLFGPSMPKCNSEAVLDTALDLFMKNFQNKRTFNEIMKGELMSIYLFHVNSIDTVEDVNKWIASSKRIGDSSLEKHWKNIKEQYIAFNKQNKISFGGVLTKSVDKELLKIECSTQIFINDEAAENIRMSYEVQINSDDEQIVTIYDIK